MKIMFKKYTRSLDKEGRQFGFSIIELLIIVAVVGILATLSTTVYASVSGRSYDTSVQNDLTTIAKKLKMYYSENGVYPAGSTQLAKVGIKVNKSAYGSHYNNGTSNFNLVYCRLPASAPTEFALVAYSKSGNGFQYSKNGELLKYTGPKTGTGSICTGAGLTMAGGASERDWFFDSNNWQSYIAG